MGAVHSIKSGHCTRQLRCPLFTPKAGTALFCLGPNAFIQEARAVLHFDLLLLHPLFALAQLFYEGYLGVKDPTVLLDFMCALTKGKVRGHWKCPCGSGAIIRNCHKDTVNALRSVPKHVIAVSGMTILEALKKRTHRVTHVPLLTTTLLQTVIEDQEASDCRRALRHFPAASLEQDFSTSSIAQRTAHAANPFVTTLCARSIRFNFDAYLTNQRPAWLDGCRSAPVTGNA